MAVAYRHPEADPVAEVALATHAAQTAGVHGITDAAGFVALSKLANLRPVAQRFARDLAWANGLSVPIITTVSGNTLTFNLAVVGDSTGVDGDATTLRWPHLLARSLAALYPNVQFVFYPWNDSNQSFDPAVVINTPSVVNAVCNVFNCSTPGTTEDYWLRQGGATTVSLTGASTTNGSRVVGVASTTTAMPKQGISGTGLPGGTEVERVIDATTLLVSNAATQTNTGQTFTVKVPRRLDVLASINPDVVFVSHGHNTAALYQYPNDGARYIERIQALTESLTLRCPRGRVVLVAQNEEVAPAANAGPIPQGVHARELRVLAFTCGYDFVDVYEAFASAAGGPAPWLTADGVHPTYDSAAGPSPVGAPTSGSALWRDTILRAMTYLPGWPEKSQTPSGLSIIAGGASGQVPGTKQLLINGDFSEYTTTAGAGTGTPTGWTTNGNVAFAKDTGNFSFPHTSSMRCTASPSAANQVYLLQKVAGSTAPIPALRLAGRTVTLAVFWRCASGQRAGQSCKANISDNVTDSTQTLTYDLAWDPGGASGGGFFWTIARRRIPQHASQVWVYLYVDGGTDNAQANVVSIQRAILVEGDRPRDIVG
jgi:lysophospholipase L1-like esterase